MVRACGVSPLILKLLVVSHEIFAALFGGAWYQTGRAETQIIFILWLCMKWSPGYPPPVNDGFRILLLSRRGRKHVFCPRGGNEMQVVTRSVSPCLLISAGCVGRRLRLLARCTFLHRIHTAATAAI